MKLSQKLRLLREEKGITQNELASTLGIGIQSVRNYEKDSLERIPNTVQLKMLKDFYSVTYEYLLDEECENKTTELLDIGKTLKLSDDAIQNIMELQKSNLKNIDMAKVFNSWLECINLSEYVIAIEEYQILNSMLETIQYFSNIDKLYDYIANCLNNSISLNDLINTLDEKRDILNNLISKSIFVPFKEHGIKDLDIKLNKFKDFCNAAHNKKVTAKDVEGVASFITGIGKEYEELTQRTIQYCLFNITELLKNDLSNNYGKTFDSIPSDYKNLLKKEGKNERPRNYKK